MLSMKKVPFVSFANLFALYVSGEIAEREATAQTPEA